MAMNPGYMTVFVLMIISILWASGWRELLIPDVPRKAIIIFMAGWLLFSFFALTFFINGVRIQINLAFIFLLGYALFILTRLEDHMEQLHTVTIATLLALLDVTLREASTLSIGYEAIVMAIATVIIQKGTQKQMTSLLLGLLIGNLVSMLIHQRSQSIIMADRSYQDLWWLTILLTRAAAMIYYYVRPNLKKEWRL